MDNQEVNKFMKMLGWEYKVNKGGTFYWQKFNGVHKSQIGISEANEFYDHSIYRVEPNDEKIQ